MIIWNLKCANCGHKMRFVIRHLCPCLSSRIELPKCPKCGGEMRFIVNKKRLK
ncbi:hypothetical protein [Methanocaldococcus sp.]